MRPVARLFSHRLDWHAAENDLAAAEARARANPRLHRPLVDLTVSNPTTVGLPDPEEQGRMAARLSAALAGTRAHVYSPAPRGAPEARQAVADSYRAAGVSLPADHLILTASSSESYAYLFKLLCDPGDAVLVPSPSYPLFDYLARLEGVVPVPYRLGYQPEDRWHIDLADVDQALAGAARAGHPVRAIVVVSPNNPTGSVLTEPEAAALDERAAARGAALIADEVFSDYIRRPSPAHVRCLAARPNAALTFSLGGLSKGACLPQMKVGWIAAGGPAASVGEALAALELIADTYLSVNAPAQDALPALLHLGPPARAALNARLQANATFLRASTGGESPLTVLDSEAGWSSIVRVPAVLSDEAWAQLLLEQDALLVQPGYFFDLQGGTFLVVSLLPPEEAFQEGIRRLAARVATVAGAPRSA
jgi:hypothetical protein